VAKWDGNTWSGLGSGGGRLYPNSWVLSLCTDTKGELYAAGEFTKDGNGYVGRYGHSANAIKTTNLKESGISVYPNPAAGSFSVTCTDKNMAGEQFYLVDIAGKVIRKGYMEKGITNVDIKRIPAGTYVLKVGGGSSVTIVKE
jgi:hypothetical protein